MGGLGNPASSCQLIPSIAVATSSSSKLSNLQERTGPAVLMLAATGGSVELIQLLHKHGAPVNATSREGRGGAGRGAGGVRYLPMGGRHLLIRRVVAGGHHARRVRHALHNALITS